MAKNGYDAIVIGGGASGMLAAIFAARAGSSVLILDQKDTLCKKIHATGNGKCNFTNKNWQEEFFRSSTPELANHRVRLFSLEETLSFFREIGIFPKERNGYYYPASEQAASVADALCREAKRLGIHNRTGVRVTGIKQNAQKCFTVFTAAETYSASAVVLATGGMASPAHGSDGSGYEFAKAFGHTVLTPLPAIVQLKAEGGFFKTLAGVRLEGRIRLCIDKHCYEEQGELLFAAYGLSGIPVMQLSRYAAYALSEKKRLIAELDLFPGLEETELAKELSVRFKRMKNDSAEEAMVGLCNHKLNYILLKECGIDPLTSCSRLKQGTAELLAAKIKNFAVRITDTNGFSNAQACAGGIPLTELTDSCESKRIPGLFFTGELCDVDGTCGGYNLQWAWSSGALAGKEIGGRYASHITAKTKA